MYTVRSTTFLNLMFFLDKVYIVSTHLQPNVRLTFFNQTSDKIADIAGLFESLRVLCRLHSRRMSLLRNAI